VSSYTSQRRRRAAGDHHAPPRAGQHHADLESSGGRLGKLLGDAAAVSAILERMLHYGHVVECGPWSWRKKH